MSGDVPTVRRGLEHAFLCNPKVPSHHPYHVAPNGGCIRDGLLGPGWHGIVGGCGAAIRSGKGSQSPLDAAAIRHALGLNKPIYIQYGVYVWGIILRGDFGHSLWNNTTLLQMLNSKIPVTL